MDLWPFGPSQMVLLTPEAADKVLVTEFYPLHDFVPKFLGPLVGYQSIAAKDGQTWKMLHNLMAPTFRPSIVKSMVPIIASKAMTIFRPTLAEYASSGQIFSMEKLSAQLIFSISSHAILGDILSEQENEELLMELEHTLDYGRILSLASLPNPLEKVSKWWRKRRAVKRTEEILSSLVLKRYAFICQETSNGSDIGGAFSGVLDRMLLECQKLDSSSKSNGKLSENSMRLITDK
jgi:cytochrome P450